MENELFLTDQNTSISSNVFSDRESFQSSYDIAKMVASSKLVPANYQGKPMDCLIAVDMANRMGVSPMMVMQNLYVVQGKPSWSGQACMAMIEASPKFKGAHPVYFGAKGTNERGCRIEAIWKETGEPVTGTDVTMKMAHDEGWINKSGSKWITMPEQMLAYRAAAFFARIYIPNALMGVYVEGEPEDILKGERSSTDDPLGLTSKIMNEAEEVFK